MAILFPSRSNAVQSVSVKTVQTKPIEGQKTGTSGLRKKTTVFEGENYLANWYAAAASNGPTERVLPQAPLAHDIVQR